MRRGLYPSRGGGDMPERVGWCHTCKTSTEQVRCRWPTDGAEGPDLWACKTCGNDPAGKHTLFASGALPPGPLTQEDLDRAVESLCESHQENMLYGYPTEGLPPLDARLLEIFSDMEGLERMRITSGYRDFDPPELRNRSAHDNWANMAGWSSAYWMWGPEPYVSTLKAEFSHPGLGKPWPLPRSSWRVRLRRWWTVWWRDFRLARALLYDEL